MHQNNIIEVVPLKLERHNNADLLSVASVFDGYKCVTQTAQWEGKEPICAYVPPDTLVPVDRPEFSFLAKDAKQGFYRVKGKKIRGVLSFGLLVPVPDGSKIGDDLTEYFGAKHYDPYEAAMRSNKGVKGLSDGEACKGPSIYCPKYDLDNGRKYGNRLENKYVWIEEKVNGENWFGINLDGTINVRSRTIWKKEYPSIPDITKEQLLGNNPEITQERIDEILGKLEAKRKHPQKSKWWKALDDTPGLKQFLLENPNIGVFGELVNTKGGFDYGIPNGQVRVFPFDLMRMDGSFYSSIDRYNLLNKYKIQLPFSYNLKNGNYEKIFFDKDMIEKIAEGKSNHNPKHLREGIVVSNWDEEVINDNRLKLKWVGLGYLEKSEDINELSFDDI